MPELPEVEILVQALREKLTGRRLETFDVIHPEILTPLSLSLSPGGRGKSATTSSDGPAQRMNGGGEGARGSSPNLGGKVKGRRIRAVERLGKYFCHALEGGSRIWFHLGMTGQLLWKPASQGPEKHDHLRMTFEGVAETLWFRDIRRFGEVRITANGTPPPSLQSLGPDPFQISPQEFVRLFKSRTGRIRNLLLNQTILSGLGNIYANESLHRAGIHPGARPRRIAHSSLMKLHQTIREVLKEAIELGGSSIDDYRHLDGSLGRYQAYHRVYGREGEPCSQCHTDIRKVVLAGRSAFFCPKCQQAGGARHSRQRGV